MFYDSGLLSIESAVEDGVVTTRERAVLETLADELGLTVRETLEIERAIGQEAA